MKFVLLVNLKFLIIANFFLLNIAEHENFSANKYENVGVGVFIFISRENFMLGWAEHEKRFITSEPELTIGPRHATYADSEDPKQPAHPRSVIRPFTVRHH